MLQRQIYTLHYIMTKYKWLYPNSCFRVNSVFYPSVELVLWKVQWRQGRRGCKVHKWLLLASYFFCSSYIAGKDLRCDMEGAFYGISTHLLPRLFYDPPRTHSSANVMSTTDRKAWTEHKIGSRKWHADLCCKAASQLN